MNVPFEKGKWCSWSWDLHLWREDAQFDAGFAGSGTVKRLALLLSPLFLEDLVESKLKSSELWLAFSQRVLRVFFSCCNHLFWAVARVAGPRHQSAQLLRYAFLAAVRTGL